MKYNYGSPIQATLSRINDVYKKQHRHVVENEVEVGLVDDDVGGNGGSIVIDS